MIYKKWRELSVDPYKIKYKNIKLINIISYLPAGNDVLECLCMYKHRKTNLILKYERSQMADFISELKTINYLNQTSYRNLIPKIIEYGKFEGKTYLVISKKDGRRLTEIFRDVKVKRKKYIYKYGKSLAEIHSLKPDKFFKAKQRLINDIPKEEKYSKCKELLPFIEYLKKNKPIINYDCFIHGDYHYANILWKHGKISAILDFEYSGLGFKEQDIACAIILRTTQIFMDNKEDIKEFLTGYLSCGNYNKKYLKWCLVNGYCHFYLMNLENNDYKEKVIKLVNSVDELLL